MIKKNIYSFNHRGIHLRIIIAILTYPRNLSLCKDKYPSSSHHASNIIHPYHNYLCKCSCRYDLLLTIFVNLYLTSRCNLITTIQRIPRISFYTWQTWLHLSAKDTCLPRIGLSQIKSRRAT